MLEQRNLLAADWFQQDQLIAFDPPAAAPETSADFGFAIAVDGDTMVVGSPQEDQSGTVSDSGAAFVYTRNDNGTATDNSDDFWQEEARLTAADATGGDNFGYSVSISGDTIVVSSVFDDDAGTSSGSAYVFTRTASVWSQQAKLTALDAGSMDEFGYSVSISGDSAVVGARNDDDGGSNAGAAYVFTRTGTSWSQQQKFTASDVGAKDRFGWSVSISADTAAIGSVSDDDGGASAGAAYVFTRELGVWSEQDKLVAADAAAGDNFGYSISVDADTVVVGSRVDDVDVSGTLYTNAGSAYVFTRTGTVWSQEDKLIASDIAGGDQLGSSVSVSGDTIVVGSPFGAALGIDSGSAYVFSRDGSTWTEDERLNAGDAAGSDLFGTSVAVSGDTIVVGSRFDDVDPGTGLVIDAGSAYAFAVLTVLSAVDQIENIQDEVDALVASGDLNGGNAGALTAKLNGALAKLNSGKANAGTNQLNAFINQINAFVRSGKLTTTQGADLIALAEAAIASASAGGSMLVADGDAAMTDATPLVHQDELLLATIGVSLTDDTGVVTADEQARLEDSLAELNTSFGAYGVSLVVLDDPANVDAQFNVVIADMTPCGDMADGVLGCTSGPGEITIVDGWNWYTSDDATALGVGQFDFQTVLTHELGHALGLTHSGDDLSVMHRWLSDGTAHRALTANDLALLVAHDPEEEPAALRAAPRTVPSDQLEVSAIAPMVYVSPVSDPAALTLSSGLASPAIRQTAATDLSDNYLLSPSSHGRSIASTVDVSSRLADSRAEDSVEHESWLIAIDAIFATEGESEEQSVGSEITLGL